MQRKNKTNKISFAKKKKHSEDDSLQIFFLAKITKKQNCEKNVRAIII